MNKPSPYPSQEGNLISPLLGGVGVGKNECRWVFCLLKTQPNLKYETIVKQIRFSKDEQ